MRWGAIGVRITSDEDKVCLFDSVTDWAFGPVFDSSEDAESFIQFTADGPDLRTLTDAELEHLLTQWRRTRGDDDEVYTYKDGRTIPIVRKP